jgi:hypothetical protein
MNPESEPEPTPLNLDLPNSPAPTLAENITHRHAPLAQSGMYAAAALSLDMTHSLDYIASQTYPTHTKHPIFTRSHLSPLPPQPKPSPGAGNHVTTNEATVSKHHTWLAEDLGAPKADTHHVMRLQHSL